MMENYRAKWIWNQAADTLILDSIACSLSADATNLRLLEKRPHPQGTFDFWNGELICERKRGSLFSQIQPWTQQWFEGRSLYICSNTIWPSSLCFILNDDMKDLNERLLPHYISIKLRVKQMENIFSGLRLNEFSLSLNLGHSWSKILFAHEVFHISDSPCLSELLFLQTSLNSKRLVLLFVMLVTLANINRWLSLLKKHTWESCGTESCL